MDQHQHMLHRVSPWPLPLQADVDADIPLPDEGPARDGDESEDSHNADGEAGSDDEGEDLQEGAER